VGGHELGPFQLDAEKKGGVHTKKVPLQGKGANGLKGMGFIRVVRENV